MFQQFLGPHIFADGTPDLVVFQQDGSAYCLLHAGLSLDLFFDPEDGGDMFFRNAD
jgi:hypothetical protein